MYAYILLFSFVKELWLYLSRASFDYESIQPLSHDPWMLLQRTNDIDACSSFQETCNSHEGVGFQTSKT